MMNATPDLDRNLLFGILATEQRLASPEAVIDALRDWVSDKTRPLGEWLQRRHPLPAEERLRLESLVNDRLRGLAPSPPPSPSTVVATGDQTALDDSSTGERPRYRAVRLHARGGLGEVYIAEDLELRREVALKEIQPVHAHNSVSRARFVAEAEITGNLEHPGIVPVYGLGTYPDGRPFYAMRFIQGETLAAAVKRFHAEGPDFDGLEFRQLLRRVVDVCNAVAYAHSRGVVHRDLKPANVMLGRFGETLVVDWGLAKAIGRPDTEPASDEPSLYPTPRAEAEATRTGQYLGTPGYMSPEQAAGEGKGVGAASDVYSLGATLYYLLTGQSPFMGPLVDVLARTAAGRFPPPRDVNPRLPGALDAVCRKAMALAPADRYTSPLELAADLERWLADEPVSCHVDPFLVRSARWARRHRTSVAAAVVLLLTTTVGLAVGLGAVDAEQQRTARERDQKHLALTEKDQALIALTEQQRRTQEALQAETEARQVADNATLRTRDQMRTMTRFALRWLGRPEALSPGDIRDAAEMAQYANDLRKLPGDTLDRREARAEGAFWYGYICNKLDRNADAAEGYQEAIAHYAALVADHPRMMAYRRQLSMAHGNLGRLRRAAKDPAAEPHLLACLEVARGTDWNQPDALEAFAMEAIIAHGDVIYLHLDRNRLAEARQVVTQMMEFRRKCLATHPQWSNFPSFTADWLHGVANRLATVGLSSEAEGLYQTARATFEAAAQASLSPTAHGNLGVILTSLGSLWSKRGDWPAARQILEQAQEHFGWAERLARIQQPTYRERLFSRTVLAEALAQMGDHAALAALAEQFAQDSPNQVEGHTAAAGYLARCIPLAERDDTLPRAERPVVAARYAEQAMKYLTAAVRKGFTNGESLKRHPSFEPLRGREDFRQLIQQLEQKAKPRS